MKRLFDFRAEKKKKKLLKVLGEEPQLIVDDAPFEYVEAFKELRTNLNFLASRSKTEGKGCKILVTSSIPGEGKSTTVINIALALAQGNHKVLLIDGDMRNPVLRKYLRLVQKEETGLSALLNNDVKIEDCLARTEYGVDVIANGPMPPNPAELIKSDTMRSLLKGVEGHYDYILFDTPPVGVITDAAALSPLCDGVLYVIRHRFASRKQVHNAIKKLKMVDANILGTILTQYDVPKNSGRRHYGYYHKYNRYNK
ncbi:MAG: CpsD/CapB family tyrosine-protein kinase [Oscillospiraceae bacterium]|nr:CpsD/CapB family tyrosine-protein kinase [Oscillospiraceae bacterium]